jgi:hypothetical protein
MKSKHILCSITFFFENRAICEIMWKNTVEPDGLQCGTENILFSYRIPKARIQTHAPNISYLLTFRGNCGYANAPQYYVIPTFLVLFRNVLKRSSSTLKMKAIRFFKTLLCNYQKNGTFHPIKLPA